MENYINNDENIVNSDNKADKIKILVADDDVSLRTSLELILEEENYEVTAVGNGEDAVKNNLETIFSIAILDYKLPDIDGIQLASKIKEANSDIEVIILTGKASLESAIKAVKEGLFDYLTKPIDPDRLLEIIKSAVEKQNLILENRQYLWNLKKSKLELERLNKFKDGLISMISHDLRSPISSIRGLNESLLEGFLGEITDKQKEVIKTQNEIVDVMMELINGLLDMSQLQVGKLKMSMQKINIIDEVIAPTIKRFEPQRSEKSININISCADGSETIYGDSARLAQVVQNLVQNSIKFTPENGNIDISTCNHEDGYVLIEIKDSGIGIKANEISNIFEVFYSKDSEVNKSGRPSSKGRGLGLAICKEIIKAHMGEIWAESEGEGKGSTFIFTLPTESVSEEQKEGDNPKGGDKSE